MLPPNSFCLLTGTLGFPLCGVGNPLRLGAGSNHSLVNGSLLLLCWPQGTWMRTKPTFSPVSPLLPPLHFPPPHSFPATSVSILFLNDFSTLLLWDLCFRVLSIWKVLPDFSFIKFLIFLCLLTAYLLNKPKFMDTTQSSSSLLIPYLLIISCSFLFFLLYHPE